jgi:hypothetical protein
MAGLEPVAGAERLRARRWDAIILGSGVCGLVAAARLGAAGHRVLVVEEDAARALPPCLREPFLLSGARDGGVLDACLRQLNIPLIDQRRIASERLAYQVISPKLRLDVGGPGLTRDELVSWGLCEPEEASSVTRSLVEATEAERKVMLASPLVRIGRRLSLARSGTQGSHVRGLPAEAAAASPELRAVLDAQVEALSNLATASATPEARARLLGVPLAGGAGFGDAPPWLLGLLRKRVEAVYGEFRSVAGRLDLVAVDQQPGIAVEKTGELWVGRALVLACATSALAGALAGERIPELLDTDRTRRRRIALQLRIHRDWVPRGMSARAVLLGDPDADGLAGRIATLTAFAPMAGDESVDLVVRMRVADDESIDAAEDELHARVAALMPFAEDRLERRPYRRPLWDDDDWLEDPAPGAGWPAEVDLRVSHRPCVYRLDRAEVGGLGLEGDLLLGWRAGDAIAQELR